MEYYIGLDLGTSHCKAVALSPDGKVLAKTSAGYSLDHPKPGWAEQDPAQVWKSTLTCLEALNTQLPGDTAAGLGLSGAMHSFFPADRQGKPLSAAMTWADSRAQPQAETLRRDPEAGALMQRTGCPLQPQYFPARLIWWRETDPNIFKQAAYFIGLKDWILYRLSGAWVMDLGMASTTGLLDIHNLLWDAQALEFAGVSFQRLPALAAPSQKVANLSPQVARQIGLPVDLPLIAGSADGGLANLGSGATHAQQTIISVGTSGAVRRITNQPAPDPEGKTWCYYLEDSTWYAGGAINNGGLALQWVKERFYSSQKDTQAYAQIMQEVAGVPPGAGGVMLLPYFSGERSPIWDAGLRATFTGLNLTTGRSQIARAALEAVAFTLADVWQALDLPQPSQKPAHLTGGITHSACWVQILSDVLGVPLQVRKRADASATGAAVLAALALEDRAQPLSTILADGIESRFPYLLEADQAPVQPSAERFSIYRQLHGEFSKLRQRLAET